MDFVNGPFLVGAAAAAAPILIHLVQRRRVRQVVFGSLRVLGKTSHRVVHRRRFAELLLVLLRSAALAIIAAAFARPFFSGAARAGAAGQTPLGEGAVLLLVDNSYSMRAGGRMQRAKEQALAALRRAGPVTKVGVAAFSSRFEERCPVGSDLDRAASAVQGIQPSWRGTNLALAVKQADRLLTRAGRSEAYRRIVLISDFQAGSWKQPGDWTLSPGVELAVRDVAAEAPGNVYVARVVVPRLVVAGGFTEVISATVRNRTDRALTDARVRFRIGPDVKGTRSVNVRAGEEAVVRFRHEFAEAGDVTGSITVEADDGLADDNTARFCVHVTPRVNVLLVNADGEERMVLNDGLFVRTALVPPAQALPSPFAVREIAPARMKPSDLDGVDVVLFLNVSKLPAALTAVPAARRTQKGAAFHSPLGRFVARGGGVGFVCGKKVSAAEFNATFAGLAPCRLLRRAMQKGDRPVVINQIDLRHEVFAPFARPHSGDFSLAKFSQYFLVTDSLGARVPARLSHRDAHPVLLERVFGRPAGEGEAGEGKGKSILFVSSLDLEWNTLCLKSVFVPFVHQLVKRLCARRTGSVRNFVVGDESAYVLPTGAPQATLRRRAAERPNDDKPKAGGKTARGERWEPPVELKARSVAGAPNVVFSPDAPGIYELAYEGGRARFAVNLDADEPDLKRLDTRLLTAAVNRPAAPRDPRQRASAAPPESQADLRERMDRRRKIWRVLLAAALVVLAIEMLLAWRIGRA